jgi:hypothetical protein
MPKQKPSTQINSSHKKKKIAIIVGCALALVLIPATALAYVGFIPGATNLMGTNTPVDLGVKYAEADFRQFQNKTLSTVSNFDGTPAAPDDKSGVAPGVQLVLYGTNTVQTNVSQEELTAFLNMTPWTASPLSHSQVRFSDGTVEFSGNVKAAYVSQLIDSLYPNGTNENLNPLIKLAGHLYNPAVYAKFNISSVSTVNGPSHGQLSFKLLALKVNQIGRAHV